MLLGHTTFAEQAFQDARLDAVFILHLRNQHRRQLLVTQQEMRVHFQGQLLVQRR